MAEPKPKILIIEDDLDIAEMLNAYFLVQGYEVFTVNWGEDGVRACQTVHPDLVILDIRPDGGRPQNPLYFGLGRGLDTHAGSNPASG